MFPIGRLSIAVFNPHHFQSLGKITIMHPTSKEQLIRNSKRNSSPYVHTLEAWLYIAKMQICNFYDTLGRRGNLRPRAWIFFGELF